MTTKALFYILLGILCLQVNAITGIASSGELSIEQKLQHTRVTQTSDVGIINWSDFNLSKDESVYFDLPHTKANLLNRITGGASTIAGNISANQGMVYLVNNDGMLFTKDAKLDIARLVASTGSISDTSFYGDKTFQEYSDSPIINHGTMQGDLIALVAKDVQNYGRIQAQHIYLAGQAIEVIDPYGDGLISFELADGVVNTKGILAATEVAESNGIIKIQASRVGLQDATLEHPSGVIDIQGDEIVIDSSSLEVSGQRAGLIKIGIEDITSKNPTALSTTILYSEDMPGDAAA